MIGSSSAALTGLMFVVITLVTNVEATKRTQDGVSTFSTPTVTHFCAALYVSAIFIAPWQTLIRPAVLLGLAGLYGVVYVARVTFRAKRLTGYTPDIEDWAWYNVVPFLAYGAILAGLDRAGRGARQGGDRHRRGRSAVDLHRDSQRMGRRDVPRNPRPQRVGNAKIATGFVT